jgi:hypothetical protein
MPYTPCPDDRRKSRRAAEVHCLVLGSLLNLLDISEAFRQVPYGVITLGLDWVYAGTYTAD